MLNFLVETKNEYTTHLTNILTPLIFEGIQSIYKEAMEIAETNDILKIFQSFLKRIPKWNQIIIEKESNRIINSSHSFGWLNDLIKATLKSNILILMYNPLNKNQKIDSKYYKDIKTTDFIHRIYIECAREIWNNPYLMYHLYPPIEIKRNQRECMIIIKECIKEAIRKLLPVKHILEIYLGDDVKINDYDNNFDKNITEEDEYNLKKLIKKDLNNTNNVITYKKNDTDNNTEKTIGSTILKIINKKIDESDKSDILVKSDKILKSEKSDKSEKLLKSEKSDKIEKSEKSDKIEKSEKIKNSETSDFLIPKSENVLMSELLNSINQLDSTQKSDSVKNKINKISDLVKDSNNEYSIDDKIKKLLKDDLTTLNSDLETSLNYTNDNEYKEIFSNSNVDSKKSFFKKYNNI